MKIDSNIRNSVLASVIAAILVILLIQPMLSAIWRILQFLGTYVSGVFVNYLYRNAALGPTNELDFIMFTFGLVFIAGGMLAGLHSVLEKPADEREEKVRRPPRLGNYPFGVAVFVFCLATLFLMVSAFTKLELNATFNQRILIIAPHVSDQKVKELRASWASMRTGEDFDSLNAEIESIAKEAEIELPPRIL